MKMFKFGALLLMTAVLVASCKDKDPNYDNVLPPVLDVSYSIGGRITAIDGMPVSGATVKAVGASGTKTATTLVDGTFAIGDIQVAGNYDIEVSATGLVGDKATIAVVDNGKSQSIVWNARLAKVVAPISVSATAATPIPQITTETVAANKAAEVVITGSIPAAAVPATKQIVITPVYSTAALTQTKASTESVLLNGLLIACSDAKQTLLKPITVNFALDASVVSDVVAKKYVSGAWVAATSEVNGNNLILTADVFASYALFLNVDVATSKSTRAVTFVRSEFDNLYGSRPMLVDKASYTYKLGAMITTNGGTTAKAAYLREVLIGKLGGSSEIDASAEYGVGVILPVGTKLSLSGVQTSENVTVTSKGISVVGVKYGNIAITGTTSNRQHTGGGN